MRTVIVLGIARSGTSMVSGILQNLDVDMNPHKSDNKQCPKGTFEDGAISNISARIMTKKINREAGKKLIQKHLEKRAISCINSKKCVINDTLWGFKGTLLHFLDDIFMPYLRNPHFVVVYRNPLMNAKSLIVNKQFYGQKYPLLLDELNSVAEQLFKLSRLLKKYNKVPQIFTTYELLKSQPLEEAEKIASFLNIDFTENIKTKINNFILPKYSTLGDK